MRRNRIAAMAVIVAATATLTTPGPGWTWGGEVHHYIAQNYSKHLPSYIDGLRIYDAEVDAKVTDPDTRKPYTPGEGPRHFIDIDAYPEFLSGTLSHDRSFLEARYGAATVSARGVVPWAVAEVAARLTDQLWAADWDSVATTIADLCHYAGDATQP